MFDGSTGLTSVGTFLQGSPVAVCHKSGSSLLLTFVVLVIFIILHRSINLSLFQIHK